ncbi:MAG: ABC transporter substrate-binding protein [Dehalococcoidia bacterium]|tara:strand:+ start:3651 stop:4901 length:1251 start_codon:yes stop_codon:yes gene_type:complete
MISLFQDVSRKAIAIVLATSMLGFLLVGCGGEKEQLKIAFLADYSGPLKEFGPVIQTGVELAIDHINAAGGVNGKDVLLVTGDSGLDKTKATEEARRLIDIEGVHGIVGPLSSGVTLAVSGSVTSTSNIPQISPSATSPALTNADDNGYLFRSTISDAAQGVILADLAKAEGYAKAGVLYENSPYGQGLAEAFKASFEAGGGSATITSYEAKAASYLAELKASAANGGEVLIAAGYPTQAAIFIKEALENKIYDKFLFVDGTKSEDLIAAVGADALDGQKGTAPGAGPETPALKAWNDAYKAKNGDLPALPFVREAYDATICLALASASAGSVAGADIAAALPQVCGGDGEKAIPGAAGVKAALDLASDGKAVNFEGAATSLDWNDKGDITNGYIDIWQYKDGGIATLDSKPVDLN